MISRMLMTLLVIYSMLMNECTVHSTSNLCQDSGTGVEPCFDMNEANYDQFKRTERNQSVTFECKVKNKGTNSVVWLHDSQLLTLDARILKPDANIQLDTDSNRMFNLKIANIDVSQKGSYKCQITTLVTKNLDYQLDVLVPPSITRMPNENDIVVNEGDSLKVQCMTEGNPKPTITWSKKGKLPANFKIDEAESTLSLNDVDLTYSDTYTCMAMNGVGTPVTSQFQVIVKHKPRVQYTNSTRIVDNMLYSSIGKAERFTCLVDAYPKPTISILFNNMVVNADNLVYTDMDTKHQVTYNFKTSNDTIGTYECIADNEMGHSSQMLHLTASISNISVSDSVYQVYSDGYVFEWSCASGLTLTDIQIELYKNDTLALNQTVKIGGDALSANNGGGGVLYKDYYELIKLTANTTYQFRIRVRRVDDSTGLGTDEWSTWSPYVTFKTLIDDNNNRLSKHKSLAYQNRHQQQQTDPKYKIYDMHAGKFSSKLNMYDYSGSSALVSFKFQVLLWNLVLAFLIGFY